MQSGITLDNVWFAYEKNCPVIKNISLKICQGDYLSIIGINGSGKSTLTYLFNGLIPHFVRGHLTGDVTVDGINTRTKNVAYFAKKVGMLFQNPDFSLFNLTVVQEIEFGLKNLQLDKQKDRIRRALSFVGLTAYSQRDPQTLSLGEKQKVSLACILAQDTNYIVLDEPTAMLDYKSSLELYKILGNLHREGKTIIVVEHDTDLIWQFSQKVLILDKGSLQAFGLTKKILTRKKLLQTFAIKPPNTNYRLDK